MATKAEQEAQQREEAQRREQAGLLRKLHKDTRVPDPAKVARREGSRGKMLDYLGHADVTDLLLAHDPHWNWEPVVWTEAGAPGVTKDSNGWPIGLWIRLTIHGVTRLGYGSCTPGKDDAVKELIGDAIRNAAMRFGIALQLWSKADAAGWGDLPEDDGPAPDGPQSTPPAQDAPKDPTPPAAPENGTQPPQQAVSGQCPECHGPNGKHATGCTAATAPPAAPAAPEAPAADPDPPAPNGVNAELTRDQLELEVGTRLNKMRGQTAIAFAEEKRQRGWPLGDLTTASDDVLHQMLDWLVNSPVERVHQP